VSLLECAYADGQLAALQRHKLAWPSTTNPIVQQSAVLKSQPTPPPVPVPAPASTPAVLSQTFDRHEQGETRMEPRRKLSALPPVLAGALVGAIPGAIAGATTGDPDHRLRGALSGAAAGGLSGAALGHLGHTAGMDQRAMGVSSAAQHPEWAGAAYQNFFPLDGNGVSRSHPNWPSFRDHVAKLGADLCGTCRKPKHYGPCKHPVPIKRANFNLGMTADDAQEGGPATSPHYSSATSADSSLARARDGRPADEQASSVFADLIRHLGISSIADEPTQMTSGLDKISGLVQSGSEKRGPSVNPYEERAAVKTPPVGWGDEGSQRIDRAFNAVDNAADSTCVESVVP